MVTSLPNYSSLLLLPIPHPNFHQFQTPTPINNPPTFLRQTLQKSSKNSTKNSQIIGVSRGLILNNFTGNPTPKFSEIFGNFRKMISKKRRNFPEDL